MDGVSLRVGLEGVVLGCVGGLRRVCRGVEVGLLMEFAGLVICAVAQPLKTENLEIARDFRGKRL